MRNDRVVNVIWTAVIAFKLLFALTLYTY